VLGHFLLEALLAVDDVIDPALAENDIGIRWGEQRPSSLIITRIAESRQAAAQDHPLTVPDTQSVA
jgi:hypothetical protein